MTISYYEYSDDGELVAVLRENAQKGGRFVFRDGLTIRIGDGTHGPVHYGSDDLGVNGVFNPADGKKYDSKSEYYKAVKAKGLEVVGDDPVKPSKPKIKPINWEKAVAETLQTTPLKGKKR
jgi:hypothetical protein